ncbi:MAG TPA: hypothetical protein PKA42_01295 [Candidatus Paceibacterota bacterium]|nr:hypothetical protein [Candidatus Paceibacterota bacterium]HMO82779.1 hypothetical protein [Candidatus Paceibacterota bacterium]
MEPENLNGDTAKVEVKTGVIAPLHKITPLSKYLAMALFISLPFIGGWIGYQYAPEKVVEVERIVSDVGLSTDQETKETEKVFYQDGRYAPDGRMLSDADMYEATGLPYVTTFSKDYALSVLGGMYSDTLTIYKYDEATQTYQSLIEDIREVAQKSGIEIYTTNDGKGLLTLWGWSNDLRYLGIYASFYGGVYERVVYYIDTHNLDKGLIKGPDTFLSSSIQTFVSPDRSKIIGRSSDKTVSDTNNNLSIFDLNTQTAKIIYTPGEKSTFRAPDFVDGGSYVNAGWLDQNKVAVKISTVDNYKMYYNDPNEGYKKFQEELETVIVNVE